MKERRFEKKFIQKNTGRRLRPTGLVLHETADPGATALDEFKFFNRITNKSAHAFIDWERDLQIVPWDIECWHARSPANEMFIGMEMCRPGEHDPEKFKVVYWASVDAAARLFRWVLGYRTVTPDNLMSHHEVTLRWKRSTHTDPTALFKEYGKTMDGFRADVQHRLNMKWEDAR